MITAGIDVGLEYTKVLILKEDGILSAVEGHSGGLRWREAVAALWAEALAAGGLAAGDVERVWATGQGKYDVDFAHDNLVEAVADARAARYLYPEAACAVDLGADQIRKVALGERGAIREVVTNQKCGGFLGIQLQVVARRLGLGLEEMSRLPTGSAGGAAVSDGCPVFAELDALELLNEGIPPVQIAAAAVEAAALRINAVLNDKTPPDKWATVLLGGMTQNGALVEALRARSGIDFLLPQRAEFAGALGAALAAAEAPQAR